MLSFLLPIGAYADLLMIQCPQSQIQSVGEHANFEIYPNGGIYLKGSHIGSTLTGNSISGNLGVPSLPSEWRLRSSGVWTNEMYASIDDLNEPGITFYCHYRHSLLTTGHRDHRGWVTFSKPVPAEFTPLGGGVACTAGLFNILGADYHFACQTTGAVQDGSGMSVFSNPTMANTASQLKALSVPLDTAGVPKTATTQSTLPTAAISTSAPKVKELSNAFLDAAKKSGMKILTEAEYKQQTK